MNSASSCASILLSNPTMLHSLTHSSFCQTLELLLQLATLACILSMLLSLVKLFCPTPDLGHSVAQLNQSVISTQASEAPLTLETFLRIVKALTVHDVEPSEKTPAKAKAEAEVLEPLSIETVRPELVKESKGRGERGERGRKMERRAHSCSGSSRSSTSIYGEQEFYRRLYWLPEAGILDNYWHWWSKTHGLRDHVMF